MENKKIKEILINSGYITQKEAKRAEKEAKKEGMEFVEYLLERDYISKGIMGQAMAEYYNVSFVNLNSYFPSSKEKDLIPLEAAKKFRVIIVEKNKDGYLVATDDPKSENVKIILTEILGVGKYKLAYALSEEIDDALRQYKKAINTEFSIETNDGEKNAQEIMDKIIEKAISLRASDIHIEPREDQDSVVRYRIDGVLQEIGHLSKKQYESGVNRVKIMAGLKSDEHMLPQDGAIRYENESKKIDLRVSIAPAISGEKVVIRILAEYVKRFSFAELGMSEKLQEEIKLAIRKPYGMILIAGPTGSGKTTSLYSMLIKVNKPGVNIVTIEDPVEYRISGVNHIQVNPEIELTFARGLRSIVRQDPDIILVGEIRDVETAEISVNASLTGHLLLSTFHANSSAVAVTRLLDMNIENFSFASTAELIISQRLVRKICENCRFSYQEKISKLKSQYSKIEKYFSGREVTLYKGKGCSKCQNQGYSGRTGIFESIKFTPEMKDLVMQKPSADKIWQLARKQGSESFFDDGIRKVEKGITTLEELYRVASPND